MERQIYPSERSSKMYGFYRVAAAVPELRVADPDFNRDRIVELIDAAEAKKASVVLFPELAVTGYTCADLFHQPLLIAKALETVVEIAAETAKRNITAIVGAPFCYNCAVYNCAFVLNKGAIAGIVPKNVLPNYREYYEKRWFESGKKINHYEEVEIAGKPTFFGHGLHFLIDGNFRFGIEICEDLWSVIPPSSRQALYGATVIFNPSASNELVGKAAYRKQLIAQQSARCIAGYVYASSGVHESSTDLVFSGHALIAENGVIVAENERFQRENELVFADIDCQRLRTLRNNESAFFDTYPPIEAYEFIIIRIEGKNKLKKIERHIDPHPFVPDNPELRGERCHEIFSIQSAGLAKRFEHTNAKTAIIGISGGLDSTLALLVCGETFKKLGKPPKSIIAITMPGYGTSDRTYNNAVDLCKLLKTDLREINIKPACEQHFKDIGHNPKVHDVTYENVQARERTQLLMDIANKEGGLVIGTGDLSEIALGWSTYNGDHMSMYAVNCSVPKTLIRYVIQWVADTKGGKLAKVLHDIIDTPVSPELLPKAGNGEITHRTEDLIGPYELHDFFLYHFIKYGAEPAKILELAKMAFKNSYPSSVIKKYLKTFFRRFFSQQFKRSCIPDGPKVGTISLSPRGDWRMPSDASVNAWLEQL